MALAGCKRQLLEETAASASAAASSAPAPAPPRCRELGGGATFTVGERSKAPAPGPSADDDEPPTDEPGLPFAVELGSAVPTADGFAVSGLSTKSGKTQAIVAVVAADAGKGRIAELGRLHGDSDPPELAADGETLVALVHDTDASGELLRLVAVRPGPAKVDVVVGAEIAESRDESRAARVALGKERGVAVWDAWHKTEKHGFIRAATFAKNDVSNVTRPRALSVASDDAEAPSVVRRPGGFWAAWISRPPKEKAKLPLPALPAPTKPKAPEPSASAAQDPALVELGARGIRVVPLDENGVVVAEPKLVTPQDAHVLVFDLAASPDGSALLAWRDDAAAPGVEERVVWVARVRADGSLEKQQLEDEQASVGVPVLLVDASPSSGGGAAAWLSLGSVSDETRFGALGADGRLLDAFGAEPVVRSGELLALSRGRFLMARPAGLAMQLSVVECAPGSAPPPASAPAPAASAE